MQTISSQAVAFGILKFHVSCNNATGIFSRHTNRIIHQAHYKILMKPMQRKGMWQAKCNAFLLHMKSERSGSIKKKITVRAILLCS